MEAGQRNKTSVVKEWVRDIVLIVIGTFLLAVGMVLFISPYKFAPGGVYGISIIIHHLFGTPIGVVGLCLDIPLLLLGMKFLGGQFGVKTVLASFLTAGFMDLVSYLWGEQALVEGDPWLAALFGGVLVGVALGIIVKGRATSGGTDIVAMIVSKYAKIPFGQSLIYVDSFVVLGGLIAFGDWMIPLYSWIIIFIVGRVIDMVIEGVSTNKVVIVISNQHEKIRDKIINDLSRGGTYLNAVGMYSGEDKKVIYTNITRKELPALLGHIREADPKAFVSVIDAHDVLGDGFKSLQET